MNQQGAQFAHAICDTDRRFFFTDIALGSPAAPDAYANELAGAMRDKANAARARWFDCTTGPDTAACRSAMSDGVDAYVVPVLPARNAACWSEGPCWRDDGDHRFFRVFFRPARNHDAFLSIQESARCEITDTLRREASVYAGAAAPGLRVGREWCATHALGTWIEASIGAAGTDAARWHLKDIGASDPRFRTTPAVVALLDSALDTVTSSGAVAVFEDQANLFDESGAPVASSSDHHPHGAAVSELIRSTANGGDRVSLPLWSYVSLGPQGSGSITHLARALDRAIFDKRARNALTERSRSLLLINLSVGWPPELEHAHVLTDGALCRTTEDGMGESVKYMLDGARRMDQPASPVLVVVAGGNRPTASLPPGLSSPTLFYPAALSRRDCAPACDALDLAVGAVDELRLPSSVSIPGTEPALVAPGEHVYPGATSFGWPAASSVFTCDARPQRRLRYTVPSAFTGTSMAAALTTGAAARVYAAHLARRVPLGEAPLRGRELARLLYATGTSVGRLDGTSLVAVRELCLPSAFDALDHPRWTELLACLQSDDVLYLSHGLEGCVSSLGFDGRTTACPAARSERIGWPSSFVPLSELPLRCTGDASTMDPGRWATCPLGACPSDDLRIADRYSSAGLGPQPGSTVCPECGLIFTNHGASYTMDLVVNLSADYPAGTTFENPVLVLTSGGTTWTVGGLTEYVPGPWVPGAAFVIKNLSTPTGLDVVATRGSLRADLVSYVTQPPKVVRDTSSLRLTYPPSM